MPKSAKAVTDTLRNEWVSKIMELLSEEEPMQTASGTLYIPCTDENGDDRWVKLSIIIPKASEEDGTDGYALAEEYKIHLEEQAEKKAEADRKKAEKIAKEKAKREEKAKAKADA